MRAKRFLGKDAIVTSSIVFHVLLDPLLSSLNNVDLLYGVIYRTRIAINLPSNRDSVDPLPALFSFFSLSLSLLPSFSFSLSISFPLLFSPFPLFFILFFFSPPFIEDSNFDLPTARAWKRVIARSITVTVFFMSSHYSLLPLKLLYLCSMALSAFFMLEGWSSLRIQCLMAFLSVFPGRKGGREYLLEVKPSIKMWSLRFNLPAMLC